MLAGLSASPMSTVSASGCRSELKRYMKALPPNTTLSHYRIFSKIGVFSPLYSAHDELPRDIDILRTLLQHNRVRVAAACSPARECPPWSKRRERYEPVAMWRSPEIKR